MDAANPETIKAELAAETARRFGAVKIKVTGDSMLPSVYPGDVLTVVRQPLGRFRPGDIALAVRQIPGGSPEFVAHRVVRRHAHHLITRGDSLRHSDPPFEEHEILGRVAAITRNGRLIDTRPTVARHLTSWVLRRSAFSVRVLLRLHGLGN